MASVCALLALSGFLAALIPARRAASIDPMQALRMD
jgi:ABC-type lipoprotein release transport system permease subunit